MIKKMINLTVFKLFMRFLHHVIMLSAFQANTVACIVL